MAKTRLVLVGGFLGAGKTTLLQRAAEHLTRQGYRVGVVTNDQGQQLVDTALFHDQQIAVQEVAGGCFCCHFPDLLSSLRRLQAEIQPDVILAEPVGSCTDLMATVLRPIWTYHAAEFEIAPLTILLDPQREMRHFGSTVSYLHDQQLLEAEVIAVNKSDLLASDARREMPDALRRAYAGKQVVSLSARTGDGVAAWIDPLLTTSSRLEQALDLDYMAYAAAEASLGWLNARFFLLGQPSLSPTVWMTQVLKSLGRAFGQNCMAIAHLKLHLNTPQAALKASLTQMGDSIIWDAHSQPEDVDQAAVILNARVSAPPDRLRATVQQAIAETCARLQTPFEYTHFECFSPLPPEPTFRLLTRP